MATLFQLYRHHFGRRVELHRAGAERDHRPVERQILVGEPAQEAHHLGFRTVFAEDGLGEEPAVVAQQRHGEGSGFRRFRTEQRCQRLQVGLGRRLVEGDRDAVVAQNADQPSAILGRPGDVPGLAGNGDGDGVEEARPGGRKAFRFQRRRETRCKTVHGFRNRLQAGRPVPDRIGPRPCWRVGPARCRCSTSPCRGGYAVRASAARVGNPGGPWRRPIRRRDGPAACGSAHPIPPCNRHAARHSRAARRSAASSRRRRRRPSLQAVRAALAPADRRPQQRARPFPSRRRWLAHARHRRRTCRARKRSAQRCCRRWSPRYSSRAHGSAS